MKAKKMKIISKITNEITSFYLEKGAEKIEIDIAINDAKNGYDIYTYGTVELSAAEVKEMKKSIFEKIRFMYKRCHLKKEIKNCCKTGFSSYLFSILGGHHFYMIQKNSSFHFTLRFK